MSNPLQSTSPAPGTPHAEPPQRASTVYACSAQMAFVPEYADMAEWRPDVAAKLPVQPGSRYRYMVCLQQINDWHRIVGAAQVVRDGFAFENPVVGGAPIWTDVGTIEVGVGQHLYVMDPAYLCKNRQDRTLYRKACTATDDTEVHRLLEALSERAARKHAQAMHADTAAAQALVRELLPNASPETTTAIDLSLLYTPTDEAMDACRGYDPQDGLTIEATTSDLHQQILRAGLFEIAPGQIAGCSGTAYGDGEYPLIAQCDDGGLVWAFVDFDPDDGADGADEADEPDGKADEA